MGVVLVSIIKSSFSNKKYKATFYVKGKKQITDFGDKGYINHINLKDKARRDRYIIKNKKGLYSKDPTTAGNLNIFILWNKPTFKDSLNDFMMRLDLYNKTGFFPTKMVW